MVRWLEVRERNVLTSSNLADDDVFSYILNSVASVRKQTIPTERLPLVGEVSANFLMCPSRDEWFVHVIVFWEYLYERRAQSPKIMIWIQSPTHKLGSVQPAVTSGESDTEAFILAFYIFRNLQVVVLMFLVMLSLSNLRGCWLVSQ
jgi:hypothetical protein